MRILSIYVIACALAGAVPLAPTRAKSDGHGVGFPGWPARFEGSPLRPLPLSDREKRFAKGFPGRIAGFTDGRRQILMRWIAKPTRRLHPASDCYRGLGYAVKPLPSWTDSRGIRWGVFEARKAEGVRVLERIHDTSGNSWADVSAWYWAALLGKTESPWWAVTVTERTGSSER